LRDARRSDSGWKLAQKRTLAQKWLRLTFVIQGIFFGFAMASITKRGKYWRAQVRRRRSPTQFRAFDTKALAEALARQLESEMDRGVFKSREEPGRTTFAEALERYWNEVVSKKRFPKLERYRINRWLRRSLSSYFLANPRGAGRGAQHQLLPLPGELQTDQALTTADKSCAGRTPDEHCQQARTCKMGSSDSSILRPSFAKRQNQVHLTQAHKT
jgi:hypothetical protein